MPIMLRPFVKFFLLNFILISVMIQCCWGEDNPECKELNQIAEQIHVEPTQHFAADCRANSDCTGVDCNGNIQAIRKVDINFCYGFKIQNCLHPTQVDVYAYEPQKNLSYERRVSNSIYEQVPGAHFTFGLIYADAFLNITMKEEANNKILFGVQLVTRTGYTAFRSQEFSRKFSLVPVTEIPVQPCTSTLKPGSNPVNHCIVKTEPTLAPPTTETPVLYKGAPIKCSVNSLHSCEENQICKPVSDGSPSGQCFCVESKFNQSLQRCVPKTSRIKPSMTSTTPPLSSRSPPSPSYQTGDSITAGQKSTSNHRVIVTAACSVAGVILLAGISIATLAVIRKRRARYADHDILLQQEEVM